MIRNAKIYMAGHTGLVGSALVRRLTLEGYPNLIVRARKELNLLEPSEVARFFQEQRSEYVFVAAAKVGGIFANSEYPADLYSFAISECLNPRV